jgi:small-conductance mechanosensitive channel
MGSKPFEEGNRVKVADDIVGDIDVCSIMFTRVRTLDGDIVEIPNTEVLKHKIVNYSKSSSPFVTVDVSVNYDVPHVRVRNILQSVAYNTDGVLRDPGPKVYTVELGEDRIKYRVKAYISDLSKQLDTVSKLNNEILKEFEKANIKLGS